MNTQINILTINDVSLTIDTHQILHNVGLSLEKSEIGCLLGPSGCGKTTLLRTIAGFMQPCDGEVYIADQKVSDKKHSVAVEERQVGMVFQDFALFPHLTVQDNIIFGLKNLAKTKSKNSNYEFANKEQQLNRATELLELIELADKAHAYPHELSGGQQQRVALARALAPKPSIILLDEPFSSIDRSMRDTLAYKIREILKKEQATTIMVTHDQSEAYAMADKIGIMQAGKLLQWDTPLNIYNQPVDQFVASFIGEGTFIQVDVTSEKTINTAIGTFELPKDCQPNSTATKLLVRPDDIIYDEHSSMQAIVKHRFFKSVTFIYLLELANGEEIYAQLSSHSGVNIGDTIGISVQMANVVVF